jgi:hypothetical protein
VLSATGAALSALSSAYSMPDREDAIETMLQALSPREPRLARENAALCLSNIAAGELIAVADDGGGVGGGDGGGGGGGGGGNGGDGSYGVVNPDSSVSVYSWHAGAVQKAGPSSLW